MAAPIYQSVAFQPPNTKPPAPPNYVPQLPLTDDEKKSYGNQYYGYPKLSKWMGSSADFFILRRFRTLSARSLLYMQNEIAQKEKQVQAFDQFCMDSLPSDKLSCGSFKADANNERGQLIKDITRLLAEYYGLVNAVAKIKETPTANKHQLANLKNWVDSYPNAIVKGERHFMDLENQGDLFPIVAKRKPPISLLMEQSYWWRKCFDLPKRAGRDESPETHYHSGTGLEIFASIVIVVFGLGFLFGPMWWLNYVDNSTPKLAIITGFIAVFAVWLWAAAGPKGFEVLAGTAAYSAVLMVYLQVQQSHG